jgi:hypothetical protein
LLHGCGLTSVSTPLGASLRSSRWTDASRTDVWRPCRLPVSPAVKPGLPSGRSCFPRRLVNGGAFHSAGHLSPASGRPPTLPIPGCFHGPVLLDTVRPLQPFLADFLLWARPPWASSAATGEACLGPMSLPGFCNHAKGRAHRTDVRTSPRAPVSEVSWLRSLERLWAVVSGKSIPAFECGPCRPKSSESACARRQQRPTRIRSNTLMSPSNARSELEAPSLPHPTQASFGPTARTVQAIGKAKGAFRRLGLSLECLSLLSVASPFAKATVLASTPFSAHVSLPP